MAFGFLKKIIPGFVKDGVGIAKLLLNAKKVYGNVKEANMRKFWMVLVAQLLGTLVMFTASYFGLSEDMAAKILEYLLTLLGIGVAGNIAEHVKNGIIDAKKITLAEKVEPTP